MSTSLDAQQRKGIEQYCLAQIEPLHKQLENPKLADSDTQMLRGQIKAFRRIAKDLGMPRETKPDRSQANY